MINPGVQAVGAAQTGGAPQFASLYVGDLDAEVTEAMLYEIFNTVGPVASIRVCRDSVSRKSLGYAYVNFHSAADAERVMDTLNYSTIKGRCCRIMWSHRDPNLRKTGNGNVFVKNLDKNVDNKALYDTFSLFGNILSCKVAVDNDGKSRGYGFVHYETAEAAKQAIEKVNNMQIGEKTVYVGEFLPRDGRTPAEVVNFTNIYIKNYPADWDEDKLVEEFKKFGEITSTMVQKDKKQRNFAFLNYDKAEAAAEAIKEMHMKDVRSEEEKKEAPHGRNSKGEPLEEPKKTKKKEENADEAAGGEEEKKEVKDPEDGEEDENDHPEHLLFCSRAMTKSEREQMLRAKFKTVTGSQPAGVNLYIKNLPDDCDDAALREMFIPFGEITSARVMQDNNKRSKGFGFVCYKTPEEATKAVSDMHLKTIKGKPLYVGLAEKKDERSTRLAARYKGEKGGGMAGMAPGQNPMAAAAGMAKGMMAGQMGMPGQYDPTMGGKGMNPAMNPMAAAMGQKGGMMAGQPGQPGQQMGMAGQMGGQQVPGQQQMGPGMAQQQMGMPGQYGAYGNMQAMNAMAMQKGGMAQQPMMNGQMQQMQQQRNMMPGQPGQPGQPGVGQPQNQMQRPGMMPGQMQPGQPNFVQQGQQMMGGPGMPAQMMPGQQYMQGKGGMMPQMGAAQQQMMQQGKGMMPGQMVPGQQQQMMQQGKGGMMGQVQGGRPGMPGQMNQQQPGVPGQQQQQGQMNQQQPGGQAQQQPNMQGAVATGPLTAAQLAQAPPGMQKQMLGEKLYPAVSRLQPEMAGKITGMMLEMDNNEVLLMLESEGQLRQKVDEAVRVLNQMNK